MRDLIFIALLLCFAVPPLLAQETRVYGGGTVGRPQHDGALAGGFGGFEVRLPADFSIRSEARIDRARKLYLDRVGTGWAIQVEAARSVFESAQERLIVRLTGGIRRSGFTIGGPGGYTKHATFVTGGLGLVGHYGTHGRVYLDARWLHNLQPTDRNNRTRGLLVVADATLPIAWRWQPFYGVEWHWQHAYQPTGANRGWHRFHDVYGRLGLMRGR